MTVKGWNIYPASVTFTEHGISKAAEFSSRSFWDGHENQEISLPSYDFEMAARLTGSLTGGEVAAELEFDGSVLYKAYATGNEVRR